MTRPMPARAAGALSLCLAIAGCGDADPPETSPPDATPSDPAGSTPTGGEGAATAAAGATSTPGATPTGEPTPGVTASAPAGSTPTDAGEATEPEATASAATPSPLPPLPAYTLSAPVRIAFDGQGVPHIYGATTADVLFAQGWVHARDRLWQMDYLRRQAEGTRAEIFGESFYDDDAAVKMLNFTYWAGEALRRLSEDDPQLVEWLKAYAAGVNAWMDAAREGRDGATWSPQLLAAGYEPAPWRPVDTLAIDKSLGYGNSAAHQDELVVWLVGLLLGPDKVADLLRPQPVDPASILPDFFEGKGDRPPDGGPRPGGRSDWTPPSPQMRARILDSIARVHAREAMPMLAGSNSWVISGAHTASGAPLLANDTHQGTGHPATYYEAQLSTADGGVDFVGYGYPGMPFFLFGHSERAAFGLTNNMADLSDLFIETVIGDEVISKGRRVPLTTREETIWVRPSGGAVADAEPRTITFRESPHGPLYHEDIVGELPVDISAAWVGFAPTTLTEVLQALALGGDYATLEQSLTKLRGGSVNIVYADVDGNIAYTARTDIPVRGKLDPRRPPWMAVPGTGDYDWTEQVVPDDLIPHAFNPERGWVATANNEVAGLLSDNDPLNGPYFEAIGSNLYLSAIYDVGPRAQRIEDLIREKIDAGGGITAQDMMDWQGDNVSRLAIRMAPYIFDAAQRRPDLVTEGVQEGLDALASFRDAGYACTLESVGCLVFHAWLPYFIPRFLADETDPALFTDLDGTYMQIWSRPVLYFLDETAPIIDALDFQAAGGCEGDPGDASCDASFPSAAGLNYFDDQTTPETVETRDELILWGMADAVAALTTSGPLGQETWGDRHTITFNDPIERLGYTEATLGPYAIDSAMFCVDVAGFGLSHGGQLRPVFDSGGPSQRTVYELKPGAITTRDVLPGGQSERPGDAHFDDQVPLYISNQTRALPFYPQEVEAAKTAEVSMPAGFPSTGELGM